jgi:hypothetical protein
MRPDLVLAAQGRLGTRSWVVKDPVRLRYFQLAEEEYTVLRLLDGRLGENSRWVAATSSVEAGSSKRSLSQNASARSVSSRARAAKTFGSFSASALAFTSSSLPAS